MEQLTYDVFISYRRNGGSEKAQLVKSEIKQRGIEEERIFLDTHSLYDGDFEHKIKEAIEQSMGVIVIISNGCFDEIKETDFWYMEINQALLQGKKIVPIFFDGITSFANLKIPEELKELTKQNAVTYQHEYADAAFDKLITFILDREPGKIEKFPHGGSINSNNRRGCLFCFKYKGCLVSVALVTLVCFVLAPMTFFSEESGRYIKTAKGGWKFLRGSVGYESEAEKVITNPEIEGALGKLARSNRLLAATELLGKSIGEIKASDEVLPKIGEYLSQTKPNEGGQKVINCFRNDANEVRMCLYDYGNNAPKLNKLLLGAREAINLAEYDIQAMQENFYKGADGIEYVSFIIPRRPQYILNGKYEGRIYECMIFNIPKDIEGGWERFKEYLIAFINDILNRPVQLWDEYMFRRGLAEMNINSRDVATIEQYMFA